MKKLLIFLDELYYKKNDSYISSYAAGSFFYELISVEKSYLLPVSINNNSIPESPSTQINAQKHTVFDLPEWHSTISYLNLMVKSVKMRKKVREQIDLAIQLNDIFWIRFPSLAGLQLIKRALKENKKVLIHHAGDIENAWKVKKYYGVKKLWAFLLSKYMHRSIQKLAKHPNTWHFCTGSKVYTNIKKQNKQTHFFIDSRVKVKELNNHKFDINTKRFVFVGKFIEGKGILDLLDIFNELSENHNNLELKIIGFGELESLIQQKIANSNFPNTFNYIGPVANKNINQYLQTSDILVFPSKIRTEGFPRVIIEAWAQSLVVISNKIGGIEGLAIDQKNILFSETEDLMSLKKNIESIIIGQADINKMQEYIVNNRSNITYEFYLNLLEKTINGL